MRTPLDLLNDNQIASPCPAEWNDMPGDDRIRHCGICQKNVYNLSALPAAEALSLLEEHGYDLCVSLYRREDGTVLTDDCPVGMAAKARRRLQRIAWLAAGWLGISTLSCYYIVADYFGWHKPLPTRTLGKICPPSTPASATGITGAPLAPND
jgi:hypothetical protein